MQTANLLVDIGGADARGNLVPLYGATPSEIAILKHIHGEDCIHDLEPAGDIDVSNAAERARLRTRFRLNEDKQAWVDVLFPGINSPLMQELSDLNLDPNCFKAEKRLTAKSAPSADAEKLAKTAIANTVVPDEDGIVDMKSGAFA